MTFIELVEAVAANTGLKKKDVKATLYAATSKIQTHVVDFGGKVQVPGFGRFTARKTKAGKAFGRELTPRTTIKFTSYR